MDLNIKEMDVYFNNKIVGFLKQIDNERVAFQYDVSWIREGFSISPFSLPLSDKVYISNNPYHKGLFGVFGDSLPDGWGEFLLRRVLLKSGVNFDKLSPLARLSLINNSGLGGLEYRPKRLNETENDNSDLDLIAKKISEEINNRGNNSNLDDLFKMGGASGGARPKVHLSIDGDDWIVKFPALNEGYDVGIEEFQANTIAKQCGIDVNEYKLFDSKISKGFFGVKRFDRINGKKKHVISLAAILETTHRIPNLDYVHLFQVIREISNENEDLYEAYRRMVFNVLYGNKDDHSKNHSFIYDEEKKGYTLTKAYDITKTIDKLEHEMTVNGNGNPTAEDLISILEIIKLSKERCLIIIEEVKKGIKREALK